MTQPTQLYGIFNSIAEEWWTHSDASVPLVFNNKDYAKSYLASQRIIDDTDDAEGSVMDFTNPEPGTLNKDLILYDRDYETQHAFYRMQLVHFNLADALFKDPENLYFLTESTYYWLALAEDGRYVLRYGDTLHATDITEYWQDDTVNGIGAYEFNQMIENIEKALPDYLESL